MQERLIRARTDAHVHCHHDVFILTTSDNSLLMTIAGHVMRMTVTLTVIMVALCNRADHYIFAL